MTKMKIQIKDNLKPEDNAMLQALYSRSPASVDDHLLKLEKSGSASFMDQYYVGYGHQSIGDCGSTTIFIEGVSMLVAKAIQDWPLYSGQESSTRYMDFSNVEFHNPVIGQPELGAEIQERWRTFYLNARVPMREHLLEKYPQQDGEDSKVYKRAIDARVFDVLRAFLPAGASTNLSWHTNLRQAADHLGWLFSHPDLEVRNVAGVIYTKLCAAYPSSFRDPPKEHLIYTDEVMKNLYFIGREDQEVDPSWLCMHGMDELSCAQALPYLQKRPKGAPVPWWLAEEGVLHSMFMLDFGSYRDLQRHRNGTIRMPLLTLKHGFHQWYIDELPPGLWEEAVVLLRQQEKALEDLDCSEYTEQNYIAMGYKVPCCVSQGLPAFMYRLELRSGKTVHPTLRAVVLEEIKQFRKLFPSVALHVDEDPDSWTIRRGKQTIEER